MDVVIFDFVKTALPDGDAMNVGFYTAGKTYFVIDDSIMAILVTSAPTIAAEMHGFGPEILEFATFDLVMLGV